jgi:HSP20 family molecular chaperone IbpA
VKSVSNDFDDIIDKIKKFFDFKSDLFDVDFLVFPESTEDVNLKFGDESAEGFKVSYHFETGMEKPEIKIEGDFDERKLHEYLKQFNLDQNVPIKETFPHKPNDVVDAGMLSLDDLHHEEYLLEEEPSYVFEPETEINDFDYFTEIILEVPGIEEEDIFLSFNEDGSRITVFAQNEKRKYQKDIHLPFRASENNYTLNVNNGLAILKVNYNEEA